MKIIYIGIAALICLLYLHNYVVPDRMVALVKDPQNILDGKGKLARIESARRGPVFVNITTPNVDKPSSTKMLSDPIQVVRYVRGWEAVMEWWPFALVYIFVSSGASWFIGRALLDNDHKTAADRRTQVNDYNNNTKLAEAERKLHVAEEKEQRAASLQQQAAHIRRQANEAEKAAATRVAKAEIRAEETERKLTKEREENQKTVAQLLKCKEKIKKFKDVDTD